MTTVKRPWSSLDARAVGALAVNNFLQALNRRVIDFVCHRQIVCRLKSIQRLERPRARRSIDASGVEAEITQIYLRLSRYQIWQPGAVL